jgi:mannose-6-phosphate isomerase class I
MGYLNFKSEYNRNPVIKLTDHDDHVYEGFTNIHEQLKNINKGVVVFETYPGTDLSVLKTRIIDGLNPDQLIFIEQYAKPEETINQMLEYNLTDDRVFGKYSYHEIKDFYDLDAIKTINENIDKDKLTIVYGFGASLIHFDTLIMVSLTRWEIQLRYRQGATNFRIENQDEDILRKYKRGYFVEWRVADRIKDQYINELDYVIDFNVIDQPKMLSKVGYHLILDEMVKRPFRMVPYFDPGVWGGQWMKEVCHLDPNEQNFAWSFDGVPEENSIKVQLGKTIVELPAQDLVQFRSIDLMGNRVHARFGKHFPIRFDLLDTFEGGNLSLQVHPLTEYIQETFGMTYTQDESYYILDAKDDGVVYLGFKENIDQDAFKNDLRKAENGEIVFDADKYVNKFPAKKHDHFLIPAGTIHCSGRNTMVLEISACVYIFTFKLWDWGRLGLDQKPRPVHLDHGFKNLQFDRDETYVKNELINHIKKIDEHSEITGLHEREFLETIRYTFDDEVIIDLKGSVNVGNLVEGTHAKIMSLDHSFDDYEVHYAETFIMPAKIQEVKMKCLDPKGCKVIKAHVR